mgnify:CR=1 FL=1
MGNENITMSKYAFERMQAKDEKNDKWRNIIIIVLIFLLALTNGAWLYAWNQYDYADNDTKTESVDIKADGNSNANYIGSDGRITNGGKDNNNENTNKNKDKNS